MYIALERAKTAREAIQVMTDLVAEYGYASTGESFSIADPKEVWILEMIGKGEGQKGAVWVARRVPDGYISAHANQSRIRQFPLNDPENALYSQGRHLLRAREGLVHRARTRTSASPTPTTRSTSRARASARRACGASSAARRRRWQLGAEYVDGSAPNKRLPLWVKPDKKLAVQDVMALMRDHFEGTPLDMTKDVGAGPYAVPYRWRPMTWKVDGKKYVHERAISTQQTGFSFVAQMRAWLPAPHRRRALVRRRRHLHHRLHADVRGHPPGAEEPRARAWPAAASSPGTRPSGCSTGSPTRPTRARAT